MNGKRSQEPFEDFPVWPSLHSCGCEKKGGLVWKRRTLTSIISGQTQQSRQIAQRAKHRPRYESARRKFNRMIGSALSLSRRSLEISHKTKKGRSMKKLYGAKRRGGAGGRKTERERERGGGERERGGGGARATHIAKDIIP